MLSASKPRAGAGCSLHLQALGVFRDEDACIFASLRDSEHPRDPSLPGGAEQGWGLRVIGVLSG